MILKSDCLSSAKNISEVCKFFAEIEGQNFGRLTGNWRALIWNYMINTKHEAISNKIKSQLKFAIETTPRLPVTSLCMVLNPIG